MRATSARSTRIHGWRGQSEPRALKHSDHACSPRPSEHAVRTGKAESRITKLPRWVGLRWSPAVSLPAAFLRCSLRAAPRQDPSQTGSPYRKLAASGGHRSGVGQSAVRHQSGGAPRSAVVRGRVVAEKAAPVSSQSRADGLGESGHPSTRCRGVRATRRNSCHVIGEVHISDHC